MSSGGGHYERTDDAVLDRWNGRDHYARNAGGGGLHLCPPKVRGTVMPVSVNLPNELR